MDNIPNNNPNDKEKKKKTSFWSSYERKFKKYFELTGTFFSSHHFINGLPLKCQDKKNIFSWKSRMGSDEIEIHATQKFGLPYGVFARLVQIWIDTCLVRGDFMYSDDGYVLNIGRSFNDFLINKIKVDNSGRYYNKIYDQIVRFTHCYFDFIDETFPFSVDNTYLISDMSDFRYPQSISIHKKYGDLIVKEKKAFPIPENALYLFRETPLGIDFLRFMIRQTYIATKQNRKIKISMVSLANQLSPQNTQSKVVSMRIREYLRALKVIWRGLNVKITKGKNQWQPSYLIIEPSNFLVPPEFQD